MLNVKQLPECPADLKVDKTELRRCLIDGLFDEKIAEGSKVRHFYTYIKKGLLYNSPCVIVAVPDCQDPLQYIESSIWLRFAEEHDVFISFAVPEGGCWALDGTDADYMNKVFVQVQSRQAYIVMQDNIYAIGVGRGAVIAQQAVMKMSSEWSGLASFGEMLPEALLNSRATLGSVDTGDSELFISAVKTQVPVWMAWKENSGANAAVCEYWKAQNDSDAEKFSSECADEIWLPSNVCKKSQINEEKIAQVRVSNGFEGDPSAEFAGQVWQFLNKACRHRSFGSKALRNRIDMNDYGFELHKMEFGGMTRKWYEYVPQAVRSSKTPVPLVVSMHGRGGSADTFPSLSGMSRVAEERGFIAVFPEAGIHQQVQGGIKNVLLWDGFYEGERIDDVGFILAMIKDILQRYNIDEGRIYSCGQSSGGMMTSKLAREASKVFAAAAPWSGLVDLVGFVLPESIDPPIPYFFLYGENDWLCSRGGSGDAVHKLAPDMDAFVQHLIKLYGLDKEPASYSCGEITYYIYRNKKRVPMLTIGRVANMPHANYPGESWISYDEFFARFSRAEDGTLLYMGEPAY